MRLAPRFANSCASLAVASRSGSPAVRKGMKALRFSARRRWKRESIGFIVLLNFNALQTRHLEAVLVAAAAEADHHHVVATPQGRLAHALDHRVGRLQRRQDALQLAAQG